MNKNLADLHLHNKFSSDGQGTVDEFCKHAIAKGIKYLAFTNHAEKYSSQAKKHVVDINQFSALYEQEREEILLARAKYPALKIYLGVEFENRWEFLEEIKYIINNFEFDLILGSLHVIDDVSISSQAAKDYLPQHKADYVYEKYFEEIYELFSKIDMDVLAHLDILKRYATAIFGPFNPLKYQDKIGAILDLIKEKNIALEVNTSGLRQEPQETYPGKEILNMAKARELSVFIGSDAHKPELVGEGIPAAGELLREVGYTNLCCFSERNSFTIPL